MIAPRTVTAPYRATSTAGMSQRVAELLATPAGNLAIDDLLDIAAEAGNHETMWALSAKSGHIEAICDALVQVEAAGVIDREHMQAALNVVCAERDALREQLAGERNAHSVAILRLEVERDAAVRTREEARAMLLDAQFRLATHAVTGRVLDGAVGEPFVDDETVVVSEVPL